MPTEFRDIPGWPGYRIDRTGVLQSCRDNAGLLTDCWKDKQPSIDRDGYSRTTLHHAGRKLFVGIHSLVLTAFGPPKPPGKSMPLHKDGNPQNNQIENLQWGFADDNAADRERHGRTARGEKGGRAKLSWRDVDEIRAERAQSGTSLSALAQRYGVSKKAILNVVQQKTWTRGREVYDANHTDAGDSPSAKDGVLPIPLDDWLSQQVEIIQGQHAGKSGQVIAVYNESDRIRLSVQCKQTSVALYVYASDVALMNSAVMQ